MTTAQERRHPHTLGSGEGQQVSYQILQGDCCEVLVGLPDGHFQTCITSPPYYNLRSYNAGDREIGQESTPEAYVARLVTVFAEVRRVLHDTGVLWVNLGDSYANCGGPEPALPAGNLLGIPWRFAFAMQQDGWLLRSSVVWAKAVSYNPGYSGSVMPESVRGWIWGRCRVKAEGRPYRQHQSVAGETWTGDVSRKLTATYSDCPGCERCLPNGGYVLRRGSWRPTSAHEMVFMFTKGGDYFCDSTAVAEVGSGRVPGNVKPQKGVGDKGFEIRGGLLASQQQPQMTRNPRNVWDIPLETDVLKLSPRGSSLPHYALFPPDLVRPMIRAATGGREHPGVCSSCGMPWSPVVETQRGFRVDRPAVNAEQTGRSDGFTPPPASKDIYQKHVSSYRPSCPHADAPARPARVLDPFSGMGTTCLVAIQEGCDATGIELNTDYARMSEERIDREGVIGPRAYDRQQAGQLRLMEVG